jgi:hypothetical protein
MELYLCSPGTPSWHRQGQLYDMNSISMIIGKGKAVPVQAQIGSRSLRVPEFLDNQHMNVARLSAVCTGRLYPQGKFQVLIPVRGCVDPRVIVWPRGLSQWKISKTPSGIEPPEFLACSAVPQPAAYVCWWVPLILFVQSTRFLWKFIYLFSA